MQSWQYTPQGQTAETPLSEQPHSERAHTRERPSPSSSEKEPGERSVTPPLADFMRASPLADHDEIAFERNRSLPRDITLPN